MGRSGHYKDYVEGVLAGRIDRLELDCEDDAYKLPIDMLEEEIEDNIRCMLDRAGLWLDDGMTVRVVSQSANDECDRETGACIVTHDFEVYDDNGWEVLASGIAATKYYVHDRNHVDVAWTSIVIPREGVKKLYDYVASRRMLKA